jgi:hypothetical protein
LYFRLVVFTETCKKMYLSFKLGTRIGWTSFPEGVETWDPCSCTLLFSLFTPRPNYVRICYMVSCHFLSTFHAFISLSELLKKTWENSWWCPSYFSAFYFCTPPNLAAESSASDYSASNSAFQY